MIHPSLVTPSMSECEKGTLVHASECSRHNARKTNQVCASQRQKSKLGVLTTTVIASPFDLFKLEVGIHLPTSE